MADFLAAKRAVGLAAVAVLLLFALLGGKDRPPGPDEGE
jgi:hypothetical protein